MSSNQGPFGASGKLDEAACRELLENAAYEMASLYHHLARCVVRAYGEEAKEVIRAAIHDWGTEKGARQRRNVQSMGLQPDIENLGAGSTMPWNPIMEGEPPRFDGERLLIKCTRCPLADVWNEHQAQDLGLLFCDEVDVAKWQAFNEGIQVERPQAKMRGDPACEFRLSMKR